MYRKTVAGVVYQDKEFLLVQKSHWNWWDFMQGGIKEGETLEQTLKRELKEELEIKKFGDIIDTNISQIRNFSTETLKHYSDRGYTGKEIYYFIVPFIGDRKKIVCGKELCRIRWYRDVDLLDIIYKNSLDQTRQILQFMKLNKLI